MLSCKIVIGVWIKSEEHRRVKKLYVEEQLTELYHNTGHVPDVGFRLKTGDIVIEKSCDDQSIILFINNNLKTKKNHGI